MYFSFMFGSFKEVAVSLCIVVKMKQKTIFLTRFCQIIMGNQPFPTVPVYSQIIHNSWALNSYKLINNQYRKSSTRCLVN